MGLITNIRTGAKLKNIYLVLEVIRRVINWPLYFMDFFSLTARKFITYRLCNGLNVLVRAKTCDRGVMTAICLADEYEINKITLPADSVIIDIGANIGTFTLHASHKAGKIFSFEPVLANFKILKENIRINNLGNKVMCFNLAVSGKREKLNIYLSLDNPGQHSSYGSGSHEECPAIMLKDIFDNNIIDQCALLKIDTEGAEYDILYNLPDDYFYRIQLIRLEFHDMEKIGSSDFDGKHNHKALKAFLIKRGYSVTQKLECFFAERN